MTGPDPARLGAAAELVPLEPAQAGELATYVRAHRAFLDPWIPLGHVVHDRDSAERFLRGYAARAARDEAVLRAIRLDGELVGGTVFRVFDVERRVCELGVFLAPAATGRGLVTLASRAMIDWAFRARAMIRVEWRADPANAPSIAVAQRLGMTREGLLRQASRLGERQFDVEVWSVLAQEWDDRGLPSSALEGLPSTS